MRPGALPSVLSRSRVSQALIRVRPAHTISMRCASTHSSGSSSNWRAKGLSVCGSILQRITLRGMSPARARLFPVNSTNSRFGKVCCALCPSTRSLNDWLVSIPARDAESKIPSTLSHSST